MRNFGLEKIGYVFCFILLVASCQQEKRERK